MQGRFAPLGYGSRALFVIVSFGFAALAHATSPAQSSADDTSGTWYWRSLESGANRWHTSQGAGTLTWHGSTFELDLRDGATGILAYHLRGSRSGPHIKATATVPDSDRGDIVLVGDVGGDTQATQATDASRQTIVFHGEFTVLALTRETGVTNGGEGACSDPRFESLIAKGARQTQATREFALPPDAWKLGDASACATVTFRVGANGRAEDVRMVESYPEGAAAKAALETIQSYRFQAAERTELGLRFRINRPGTD